MRVWNLQEQSCTAVLKAHLSYVTSLAFLPGNSGLISGGRDRVLNVWDLDRWAKLQQMQRKMQKKKNVLVMAIMREAFMFFVFTLSISVLGSLCLCKGFCFFFRVVIYVC